MAKNDENLPAYSGAGAGIFENAVFVHRLLRYFCFYPSTCWAPTPKAVRFCMPEPSLRLEFSFGVVFHLLPSKTTRKITDRR